MYQMTSITINEEKDDLVVDGGVAVFGALLFPVGNEWTELRRVDTDMLLGITDAAGYNA